MLSPLTERHRTSADHVPKSFTVHLMNPMHMRTPPTIRSYRAALVVLLALTAGCGSDDLTCPLAGDLTGLTVELSAVPVGPFTVEIGVPVFSPSPPVSYTYRGDGGPPCRTRTIRFPGLIATNFTVRGTTERGERNATPPQLVKYIDTYPNGRACEPRSKAATVQAAIGIGDSIAVG